MKKLMSIICMVAVALTIATGADAKKKEVAFQMYNLRGLIGSPELYAKNHVEVLQKVAKMGYTAVEAANYDNGKLYGVTPEQFKADMDHLLGRDTCRVTYIRPVGGCTIAG